MLSSLDRTVRAHPSPGHEGKRFKRLVAVLGLAFLIVLVTGGAASAHNSFSSSSPADGATLPEGPTAVSLTFTKAVELDTLTVRVQESDGSSTKLSAPRFGPSGSTEALYDVALLTPGKTIIRWKLVGADGHVVAGAITFTVAGAVASAEPTPVSATGSPGDPASGASSGEPWVAPSALRWLLRYGSYLALLVVAGIVLTDAFVWRGALDSDVLRRCAVAGIATAAIAAAGQLLFIASDINGIGSWRAAIGTDAGRAFLVRIVLLAAVAVLLNVALNISNMARDIAVASVFTLLFGTWAYAGHSRSMRWPAIGVPLDIAHHMAAAAWLGGLGILTFVVVPAEERDTIVDCVRRFADVAAASVAVIVVTGAAQSLRLLGNPLKLLSVAHGRFLLLKLLVLVAMLKIADINRRRVANRFRTDEGPPRRVIDNTRRAMRTEFGVGLVVIGITSAMVVSPPAVATSTGGSRIGATQESAVAPAGSVPSSIAAIGEPATATTLGSQARPCVVSGVVLRLGSSGEDVTCLQQRLNILDPGATLNSRAFDNATKLAVQRQQSAMGLNDDGEVGPTTGAALEIWPTAT